MGQGQMLAKISMLIIKEHDSFVISCQATTAVEHVRLYRVDLPQALNKKPFFKSIRKLQHDRNSY